jgi:transposase
LSVSPSAWATRSAIVAIARKLLVAVWHVLTEQQANTNAQVQAVARKLLNWISYHGMIPGQHRDRLLLLYQHLDELGLSEELEEIDYYGTTYRLSAKQRLLREAQKNKSD